MPEPSLAVISDAAVWQGVRQVGAATDVEVERLAGLPPIGRWRRAPLVVLDGAAVVAAAAADLPRRDGLLIVVTAEPPGTEQWRACVALGVRRVLTLGADDQELARLLTEATAEATAAAPGGGQVLAVIGACGGAGATVFALAAGMTACRSGRRVLLGDLTSRGAGARLAAGLEDAGGTCWGDISASRGRLPASALHHGLPAMPGTDGALSVLGSGRDAVGVDPRVVTVVLDAVVRAGEIAIMDLPGALDPAAETALARSDHTLLVTTADVRGCYAAARAVPALTRVGTPVGLVVRGPSPGGLGADDIADVVGLPLVAAMRPQPGLARALDAGRGIVGHRRGPLVRAARAALRHTRMLGDEAAS